MSNPVSRGTPRVRPPRPATIPCSARSFMSITRRHSTRRASIPSAFPWCKWLSSIAASRLCAALIAAKSPVKCRLMSSIGSTCAYPPPAAPPFTPNTGPNDGSRVALIARCPSPCSACVSPIVVVVLPSPAGVGVIAVTRIRSPSGPSFRASIAARVTLAFVRPYGSISSAPRSRLAATSSIGFNTAPCAISISGGCDGLMSTPISDCDVRPVQPDSASGSNS